MHSIITHPGSAHRDEFLAVCFVIRMYPEAIIYRREPTPEDKDDVETVLVDCGMTHDPLKNNFDHHQMARDADPCCALTLVLEHLGYDLDVFRSVFPWMAFTERLDSKGPFAACESLGISRDALAATLSPIEAQCLQMFQGFDEIHPYDGLWHTMHTIADGIRSHYGKINERMGVLDRAVEIYCIGDIDVLDATDIDRDDNPVLGLEQYCLACAPGTQVTVTQDDRGTGLCLFRRNDDPAIDFSLIEGEPGVVFAHKNGFVAKIAAGVDPIPLIRKSIVRETADDVCFAG